jgi:hypothetical protein
MSPIASSQDWRSRFLRCAALEQAVLCIRRLCIRRLCQSAIGPSRQAWRLPVMLQLFEKPTLSGAAANGGAPERALVRPGAERGIAASSDEVGARWLDPCIDQAASIRQRHAWLRRRRAWRFGSISEPPSQP